ncbi:MAG: MiaB/RimO family radical SAM methylthiotransferase [Candidatus Omnitrophica bacterium]|nr:MiaB/RimO family radical SAM methylthiotransferase [Candidatus Omnitrophota bacterium]
MKKQRKKTFSLISLGCFRNTYDTEIAANRLLSDGYIQVELGCKCDVLLINTCGFIADAKREALEVISQAVYLKNKGTAATVIVFGCLVKRYEQELKNEFPEIDAWHGIEPFADSVLPRAKIFPEHIDFIKISEGCINNCTYCAIPLIKGKLVSKSKENILKEIKRIDNAGVKELNIIGQDITSWGRDLNTKDTIAELLEDILKVIKKIEWVRLLYLHPDHLTEKLLDVIASDKRVCKYIDLPIQHINNRILKLMNRRRKKEDIIKLIALIRKKLPGCVIRTSLIAGFPTETREEFDELMAFVEKTRFDRLGVFIYSNEDGTKAGSLKPQVHYKTKQSRYNKLMALQQGIVNEKNNTMLGLSRKVLIEGTESDFYVGRSQYDAYQVDGEVFIKEENLTIGKIYDVEIIDSLGYDLVGKIQ